VDADTWQSWDQPTRDDYLKWSRRYAYREATKEPYAAVDALFVQLSEESKMNPVITNVVLVRFVILEGQSL